MLLPGRGDGVRSRQSAARDGARLQIAFPLTHEAFAKLAGDLTADV